METRTMRELSCTPVRHGPYYCAPACGGKCTIIQHDQAVILANRVAKRLGEEWKPYVMENLGWHSKVEHASECLKISINKYGKRVSYTAFLGEPKSAGGTWAESGDTAEEAIENVCAVAHAELKSKLKIASVQLALIEGRNLYRAQRLNTPKAVQPSPKQ